MTCHCLIITSVVIRHIIWPSYIFNKSLDISLWSLDLLSWSLNLLSWSLDLSVIHPCHHLWHVCIIRELISLQLIILLTRQAIWSLLFFLYLYNLWLIDTLCLNILAQIYLKGPLFFKWNQMVPSILFIVIIVSYSLSVGLCLNHCSNDKPALMDTRYPSLKVTLAVLFGEDFL